MRSLKSALIEDNIIKNPLILKEAFNYFDRNKDGTISIEDLKNALNDSEKGSKINKNQEVFNRILEEADLNNDKKIDFIEFHKLWSFVGY